jgi:hypothetical protein
VRHFHEKLREEHAIELSYTWVKQALQGAGLECFIFSKVVDSAAKPILLFKQADLIAELRSEAKSRVQSTCTPTDHRDVTEDWESYLPHSEQQRLGLRGTRRRCSLQLDELAAARRIAKLIEEQLLIAMCDHPREWTYASLSRFTVVAESALRVLGLF